MTLPDGIYQWNHTQPYGPSTECLAQIRHGRLVRFDRGYEERVALTPALERSVLIAVARRVADHARWGAQLEFTPAVEEIQAGAA
ncbi:hypothetical protein [Deinococcus navajonensis]|uniref:Uncharacterized protein n=1 Tax=Deinococcus navajonensis TaxID=309884 RepID=A0ABV8XPY6_9DEIO